MTTLRKRNPFTLVEIMIVVAIIGILAAIAVPQLMENRRATLIRTMEANVKQIRTACSSYLAAHPEAGDGAAVTWALLSPYMDVTNQADLTVNGDPLVLPATFGDTASYATYATLVAALQ